MPINKLVLLQCIGVEMETGKLPLIGSEDIFFRDGKAAVDQYRSKKTRAPTPDARIVGGKLQNVVMLSKEVSLF